LTRKRSFSIESSTIILAPATLTLWILAFYCVFHSGLNAQAEMMRFEDREFYLDWCLNFNHFKRKGMQLVSFFKLLNEKAMSEFWRLWNRPVYKWMTRHVSRSLNFKVRFILKV
jgi:diacylglycerol O-acyltransferase 1